MKKLFLLMFIGVTILFLTVGTTKAENYTMSWNFRIFNNPNARQVAINTAEKQDSLVEKQEEDVNSIERFIESFERRLLYSIQRSIIDDITDDETAADGSYKSGDLEITIEEDLVTGEVTLTLTDLITGEKTVISYSTDDYQ